MKAIVITAHGDPGVCPTELPDWVSSVGDVLTGSARSG